MPLPRSGPRGDSVQRQRHPRIRDMGGVFARGTCCCTAQGAMESMLVCPRPARASSYRRATLMPSQRSIRYARGMSFVFEWGRCARRVTCFAWLACCASPSPRPPNSAPPLAPTPSTATEPPAPAPPPPAPVPQPPYAGPCISPALPDPPASLRCVRDADCVVAFDPCGYSRPPGEDAWKPASNRQADGRHRKGWAIKVPDCRTPSPHAGGRWLGDAAVCRAGQCRIIMEGCQER